MFSVGTDAITANHTSKTKVYVNEFVANVLRDNLGSKKNQPPASEKNEDVF